MSTLRRRCLVGIAVAAMCAPVAVVARPASAFPKHHTVIKFNYKVLATTYVKKLDQTITTPGRFKGGISIEAQRLEGSINLPPVSFTFSQAGIPLVTATAQIVQAKPVKGTIDLRTLKVKVTSSFNMRIRSAYVANPSVPGIGPLPVALPPVNLVGDQCTTETPIVVTMAGKANLTKKSTFKGTFTIPNFKTCSLMTDVLNQLVPGPGNTFSATATPPPPPR
jgi:hypothetical protein